MKRCFRCGKTKALSEFYKHKQMGDGHLGKCKDCTKADQHAYYRSRIQEYKEYNRARAMLPHRVEARKQYLRTDAGRAAYAKAHAASSAKYPERTKAKQMLANAVRDRRVIPLPCFVCGAKAQAHHPSYSQPLDVVWLCTTHHREVHKMPLTA